MQTTMQMTMRTILTPVLSIALLALLAVGTSGCNGECLPGFVKIQNQCVPYDAVKGLCSGVCAERTCGDDGCGGSCGECKGDTPYCVVGNCAAECTPACEGKVCGDDGCNKTCGTCKGDDVCSPSGKACVPKGFTCGAQFYGDGQVCDCGCGVADPDCDNPALQVAGCLAKGATCDASSQCQGGGTWTCDELAYDDGLSCDCGCGAPDPDCTHETLPITGCAKGQVCDIAGACAASACTPNCTGKSCGPNGCGASCGDCPDTAPFCTGAGTCAVSCVPSCNGKSCGDNGCGGSCGNCAAGQGCDGGVCQALPAQVSCAGHCGVDASSGCGCAASCIDANDCCVDAEAACGCFPKCTNLECGDNGCGGSCGSCDAGETCAVTGVCVIDLCSPDPCSGHGTCQPSDGTCTCSAGYAGAACNSCRSDYTGYPTCVLSLCDAFSCNGHGTCTPATGACACAPGFMGTDCETCTGAGVYPACP